MTRFILSMMISTLALAFPWTDAVAQAAAESVLLNANSATTALKAGTALGSALTQVNKQLGGQVQQVTHPALGALSPLEPQHTATVQANRSGGTVPTQGALITSIKGSVRSCDPNGLSPTDKSTAPSGPKNCAVISAREIGQQKYKSVMTVSFPK